MLLPAGDLSPVDRVALELARTAAEDCHLEQDKHVLRYLK